VCAHASARCAARRRTRSRTGRPDLNSWKALRSGPGVARSSAEERRPASSGGVRAHAQHGSAHVQRAPTFHKHARAPSHMGGRCFSEPHTLNSAPIHRSIIPRWSFVARASATDECAAFSFRVMLACRCSLTRCRTPSLPTRPHRRSCVSSACCALANSVRTPFDPSSRVIYKIRKSEG
jgi:hypothetical protein